MLNWTNVAKWLKFKIRHCKNVHCSLSKISLHYHTVIGQTLTVFHQLFSWTSVGHSKCPIDKRSVHKAILQSEEYPENNMASSRSSFKTNSFEMNEIWITPLKKKLHFRKNLPTFSNCFRIRGYKPFTNCSFGLQLDPQNFCLINKMIGSQGHLRVWEVPRVPCVLAKKSFTENYFEMNKF